MAWNCTVQRDQLWQKISPGSTLFGSCTKEIQAKSLCHCIILYNIKSVIPLLSLQGPVKKAKKKSKSIKCHQNSKKYQSLFQHKQKAQVIFYGAFINVWAILDIQAERLYGSLKAHPNHCNLITSTASQNWAVIFVAHLYRTTIKATLTKKIWHFYRNCSCFFFWFSGILSKDSQVLVFICFNSDRFGEIEMCKVDILKVLFNMHSKAFQDNLNEKSINLISDIHLLFFSKTGKYAWFSETNPKGKNIPTNYYEYICLP